MKAKVLAIVAVGLGSCLFTTDADAALFGRRTRCFRRQPIQCVPQYTGAIQKSGAAQKGGDAAQKGGAAERGGPISSLNAALGSLGADLTNIATELAANNIAGAQTALQGAQNSLTNAQVAASGVGPVQFGAAQAFVSSESSGGFRVRGRLLPRFGRCR